MYIITHIHHVHLQQQLIQPAQPDVAAWEANSAAGFVILSKIVIRQPALKGEVDACVDLPSWIPFVRALQDATVSRVL